MGHIRRRNDDLVRARHDRLLPDGESGLSLLDDEGLGVWMAVEPRAVAGIAVDEENETGAAWSTPSKRYELPLSGRVSARTTFTTGRIA
jgi:hypothetical protein